MSPIRIPRWVRELKRKRPEFVRQESWRYVRLKPNWRRPRGKDSKVRLQRSGWPQLVKVGYRTPRRYRGLHPSGYQEVLVHRVEELATIDPQTQAVRIAGSVGRLKRMKIMEEAERLGLKVLNPLPMPAPEAEVPEIIESEEVSEESGEEKEAEELPQEEVKEDAG